jgi:hypothetical protein
MGFNRRKMEDQRREAAEKEAASRRATADPRSSPRRGSDEPHSCAVLSIALGILEHA